MRYDGCRIRSLPKSAVFGSDPFVPSFALQEASMSLALTTPPAPLERPAAASFPPDRHPVAVYLARLAPSSRRPMRAALADAARLLTRGHLTAEQLPWQALARQHLIALRS